MPYFIVKITLWEKKKRKYGASLIKGANVPSFGSADTRNDIRCTAARPLSYLGVVE
jgi:hypothetical protein